MGVGRARVCHNRGREQKVEQWAHKKTRSGARIKPTAQAVGK